MGKFAAILGLSLAAAGGATYGLYRYTDLFGHQVGCGSAPGSVCPMETNTDSAAIAVAGPAAILPTSPVSAGLSCCEAPSRTLASKPKAKPVACCEYCTEDEAVAGGALAAVSGTAVTAAK
jgi:hypothetical protein